jgi:hypothetical protein
LSRDRSDLNADNHFNFNIVDDTNPTLAGQAPTGQWQNLSTSGCTGYGFTFSAQSITTQISNVNLFNSDSTEAGAGGLYLNLYNQAFGAARITDFYTELSGVGKTGPGGTNPSNLGDGIFVSGTTHKAIITGGVQLGNSYAGIENNGYNTSITGTYFESNGAHGGGGTNCHSAGICQATTLNGIIVTGAQSNLNTGYGVDVAGGNLYLTGVVCIVNTAGKHSGTITSNVGGSC